MNFTSRLCLTNLTLILLRMIFKIFIPRVRKCARCGVKNMFTIIFLRPLGWIQFLSYQSPMPNFFSFFFFWRPVPRFNYVFLPRLENLCYGILLTSMKLKVKSPRKNRSSSPRVFFFFFFCIGSIFSVERCKFLRKKMAFTLHSHWLWSCSYCIKRSDE